MIYSARSIEAYDEHWEMLECDACDHASQPSLKYAQVRDESKGGGESPALIVSCSRCGYWMRVMRPAKWA